MEALLRFHSDQLGTISPLEFIPILENTRAIKEVGLWVMEEVIKQNKIWNEKYDHIKTGFNVSYLQLYNDSLVHQLIDMVREYQVKPELMVLELTESCKVAHPESLASMFKKLIHHGFLVALDDFGMDHSFVRTITDEASQTNKANLAIISGIITMCKQLSYNVVVEGVETSEVAEIMKRMGAEYLQGYYYSKPIPAKEVEKLFLEITPVSDYN